MRPYMFGYSSVKNYLDLAYHPVETAMTNHDDLVHLLVRLGASVNRIPKNITRYYSNDKDRVSLRDWIEKAIDNLDGRIELGRCLSVKAPAPLTITLPKYSGWQKFFREYEESLKTIEHEERRQKLQKAEEKEERERSQKLEEAKAYFAEVKELIDNYGAKSMKEIEVVSKPTVPTPSANTPKTEVEPYSYIFLSTGYNAFKNVPQHLVSSYDELFESCFVGDNEKIQSLCLPAEGAKPGSTLLNISVQMQRTVNHSTHGKRLLHLHEDKF